MFSSSQRLAKIANVQKVPKNIRNICIIAHVDHGKTTLSDCLISSNNIISKKLVGKLRYLDSRPDEQERLITMKSSSISLHYPLAQEEYLINLIDSPGHIEFSSEVSSALRLTDGALLLVDALEGVSSQTYTVLKQAFEEKVSTILVINKIDRLILELKMTPLEAYKHITIIIDNINALLSSLITSDMQNVNLTRLKDQKKDGHDHINTTKEENEAISLDENILEEIEEKTYFSPEKNNVVFCSAIDTWAFTISDFAHIISAKLGCREKVLQKYLWGDFYLNPRTKLIHKNPIDEKSRPLFVQFIFESIWQVYERIYSKEEDKIDKMAKGIKITLPDNFSTQLKKDHQSAARTFMNSWLPLDKSILYTVIHQLPNPIDAQKYRLSRICKRLSRIEEKAKKLEGEFSEELAKLRVLKKAVEECDNSPDAPIVIYVSKIISVPKENFNEHGLASGNYDNLGARLLGFARIFSGVLGRGKDVYVINPKKKTNIEIDKNESMLSKNDIVKVKINTLYLLMAQYLEGIKEIPAGNCFAIGDLENTVFKNATISSFDCCPSFTPMSFKSTSLLKVTLSPFNLEDYPKLTEGLKKLNKADPSVEISMQENGDIILSTCGEVHLQRCIRDLEDTFAKIKIKISEPIVSFKETIITNELGIDEKKRFLAQGAIEKNTAYEVPSIEKEEKREKKDNTALIEEQMILNIMLEEELPTYQYEDEAEEEKKRKTDKKPKKIEVMPKQIVHKNRGKIQLKTGKLNYASSKKRTNVYEGYTPNQKIMIKIRAVSLNFEVAEWLEKKTHKMRRFFTDFGKRDQTEQIFKEFLAEFNEKLRAAEVDPILRELINKNLVCFGPRKCGPNLLINKNISPSESLFSVTIDKLHQENLGEEANDNPLQDIYNEKAASQSHKSNSTVTKTSLKTKDLLQKYFKISFEEVNKAIANGFELATLAGPLCEEPMIGAIFIVEDLKINEEIKVDNEEIGLKKSELSVSINNNIGNLPEEEEKYMTEQTLSEKDKIKTFISQVDPYGPISGQIISTAKEVCLESFLGASPRLVEGMYLCYLQTDTMQIGKVYDVLNKRRAIVLDEELQDSNNLFMIRAHLPITESFGFYEEILRKTSGTVNPQLEFDTWKILQIDPFYLPETEDELEEFGDKGILHNLAKIIIDKVRKRKGILTEEKIDLDEGKHKTLSKKR